MDFKKTPLEVRYGKPDLSENYNLNHLKRETVGRSFLSDHRIYNIVDVVEHGNLKTYVAITKNADKKGKTIIRSQRNFVGAWFDDAVPVSLYHEGEYLDFYTDGYGHLILSPNIDRLREDFYDAETNMWSRPELWELVEDLLCDEWTLVEAEEVGALTEAPMISDNYDFDGDEKVVYSFYYLDDYAVHDYIATLLDGMCVFFTTFSCYTEGYNGTD